MVDGEKTDQVVVHIGQARAALIRAALAAASARMREDSVPTVTGYVASPPKTKG